MGTTFEVSIWDEIDSKVLEVLKKEIIDSSENFNQKYSRFITTSVVWGMAGKTGRFVVDDDFITMLKVYVRLYKLSGKKFNPLIGYAISDMGYDQTYRLTPADSIRKTPDFELALEIIDDQTIQINTPVLIDFGGVGKGYFVDKIQSFLKGKGIKRFLVNGSGDIYYSGNGQSIKVGLEDPTDHNKVIGTFEIYEGALAASGISRRSWGDYHHIIDPLSNTSPKGILASWVYSQSATVSDSLATCLFLCDSKNFKEFHFDYALLDNQFVIKNSTGFKAEFFKKV